jgi:hypothetical protein
VGGPESSEFLYTNNPGDLYSGARVEWSPQGERNRKTPLRLGGHGSRNRHRNASLDASGPVFDLDRRTWSVDLHATPWPGQRGGAFLGGGRLEDFWGGQPYRLRFRGWGVWWLWAPGVGPWEAGLRCDDFRSEYLPVDDPTRERHWTLGVNWQPATVLRIQLNYVRKTTSRAAEPDPADDLLVLHLQAGLSAALPR